MAAGFGAGTIIVTLIARLVPHEKMFTENSRSL